MEQKFEIIGGKELSGEIEVNGAKNYALKVLASLILGKGKGRLSNFPFIEDTKRMLEILEELGAKVAVNKEKKEVEIDVDGLEKNEINDEIVKKFRASIILSGPILAKFGKVKMAYPGGCVIGKRPIDIFLEGYAALGVKVKEEESGFSLEGKVQNGSFFFPKITVTGTETLMMACALSESRAVLENCAMEPEIKALADFLNRCGAQIKGAGTPTMEIQGVKELNLVEEKVIPDRIETGTFIMLGLASNSEITIKNCCPKHLGAVLPILEKAGAQLEIGDEYIKTKKHNGLKAVSITTHEYPGFATDIQPPYTILMTQATGVSIIHEAIFEGRLFFTDQLNAMGANIIMCDPHRVVVSGPVHLHGKELVSPDLRAGIAMVIAGIIASGKTTIGNVYHIDRGYEKIEERLGKLGVEIKRIQ